MNVGRLLLGILATVALGLGVWMLLPGDRDRARPAAGLRPDLESTPVPTGPEVAPGDRGGARTGARSEANSERREPMDLRLRAFWARTGQPAREIEIRVQGLDPEGHFGPMWSLASDRDGEARLPGLARGDPIRVQVRGGPWEEFVLDSGGVETELVLRVPEAYPLLVRVLTPGGTPCPGARVFAVSAGAEPWDLTGGHELGLTGEDGTLSLDDAFGLIALVATAESYSATPTRPIGPGRLGRVPVGAALPSLELRLGEGGAGIELIVLDRAGQPVADARAVLWPFDMPSEIDSRPPQASAVSDDQGRASLGSLALGRYFADVHHLRAGSWRGLLESGPGLGRRHEIRLTEHGTLVVRPRAAGGPVPEAAVSLRLEGRALRGRTGPDGEARLAHAAAGPATLVVTHAALGRAEIQVEIPAGRVLVVEPVLERRGTLAGVVRDSEGRPRAHWQVLAIPTLSMEGESSVRQAMTDGDGRFQFVGCAWVSHLLEVRRNPTQALANGDLEGVRPNRGDLVIFVEDEPRAASVRGRLAGHGGLGAVRLRWERVGADAAGYWPLDPEDGSFLSGPLAGGRYTLSVRTEERDYPLGDVVELRPGEVRDLGVLAVPAPTTLEVEWGGTAPFDSVEIRLISAADPTTSVDGPHRLRGGERLELNNLPPGTYWLLAEKGFTRVSNRRIELASGAREVVRLEPDSGHPVSWMLEIGEPVAAAYRIRLHDRTGTLRVEAGYPALAGRTFLLAAVLPTGTYRVEVWAGERLLDRFDADVPESPTGDEPLGTWLLGER